MSKRYDFLTTRGGPAFPSETPEHYCPGMSLRDYFAAQAMTGMIACQDFMNELIDKERPAFKEDCCYHVARWAYMHADAMLKAREATNA